MNRQIKFRAWNLDDNKMVYPLVFAVCTDGKLNPLIKCSDGNRAYKDYPLMQFTGLTDKNGKEIYEGDIFQVAGRHKYIVKYMVAGEYEYELIAATFVIWLNDEVYFPFDEYSINNGNVIGNIYENPELIK